MQTMTAVKSDICREISTFTGKVIVLYTGQEAGDMSVNSLGYPANMINAVSSFDGASHINRIFIMRAGFSRLVAVDGKTDAHRLSTDMEVYKTIKKVDALITSCHMTALAVAPADCMSVVIKSWNSGQLALVHAGLKCLLPRGEDIISRTLKVMGEPSGRNCSIWFGLGARECCYGFAEHLTPDDKRDEIRDILDRIKDEYGESCLGEIVKGPRRGGVSVSVRDMIRGLAVQHQFKFQDWSHSFCTSCAYDHSSGKPAFFSNLRPEEKTKRNLVLVYNK